MSDSPRRSPVDPRRQDILRRMRRTRDEIDQQIAGCDHWNRSVRTPDEEPINPDPFGELRRLRDALDKVIREDRGEGPIAAIDFQRSH